MIRPSAEPAKQELALQRAPLLLRQIHRDRVRAVATRITLRSLVDEQLATMKAAVLVWVERARPVAKIAKARRPKDIEEFEWEEFQRRVEAELQAMAADGAREALEQVHRYLPDLLNQANEEAIRWASERAAELVKEIDETTRQGIRDAVGRALEEGASNEQLAQELGESHLFSESRSETVARTETAFADTQGNLAGWKTAGVVAGKEWKTSDDPCDRCADLDGEVVALEEEFSEGDPPLHPRCECLLLPVLADDAGA